MKKLLTVLLLSLFCVTVVFASYPVSFTTELGNGVQAKTTVSLVEGMQVAVIIFEGSSGELGEVTLSTVNFSGKDIEFKAGSQWLKISSIKFQDAWASQKGKVDCTGSTTDDQGENEAEFKKVIATW